MTIQVLVKVGGTKKHRAMIHAYDAEKNCAVCYKWPTPGDEWEVQYRDVELFSQIPHRERCLRCEKKLNLILNPPVEKEKPLSKKERRRQAELEKWERWTGTAK